MGALPATAAVKGRDGGYSVLFGKKSVWLYGDTVLSLVGEDGSAWRDNSWSWTEDTSAADGLAGFSEPVDSLGAPQEFFPETDDEAAFNRAHSGTDCQTPCMARRVLWPMDLVEDRKRSRVLIFYEKIYGEPGAWNFYAIGFGVAVWRDITALPERPVIRPESAEPTLLFDGEQDNFGDAALIVDDTLYAYACSEGTGVGKPAVPVMAGKPCRLGRVVLEQVLDRGAWRFWDGSGWSDDLSHAGPVFEGSSQLTVHWNEHLQQYLAAYIAEPFDHFILRTAPAPEGPWSSAHDVFTAQKAAEGWVYCGLLHKEYSREGGRIEYATYFRSTGPWTGEIRLVELELGRE
ncbi:MAG: DUF4185 domain-containing protein [Nitrospirae bacterium]|nr:DUF4185 domain-containing protein [Nitrospirota bacterium]